jgi:hypothetical protein
MGFGDKLKDLRKQAAETVAEHKDQIQGAVEVAGAAANQKTRGRYGPRIAKFGEKASAAVEKFGAEGEPAEGAAAGATHADAETPTPETAPSEPVAPRTVDAPGYEPPSFG